MKVYRLLYSRSLSRDYRWIYSVDSLAEAAAQVVQVFLSYRRDDIAIAESRQVPILIGVDVRGSFLLANIRRVSPVDYQGRAITALEGVVISSHDAHAIPSLILHHARHLRFYENLDAGDLDRTSNVKEQVHVEVHDLASARIAAKDGTRIEHDAPGIRLLAEECAASPRSFLFGASAKAIESCRKYSLVVPLDRTHQRSVLPERGASEPRHLPHPVAHGCVGSAKEVHAPEKFVVQSDDKTAATSEEAAVSLVQVGTRVAAVLEPKGIPIVWGSASTSELEVAMVCQGIEMKLLLNGWQRARHDVSPVLGSSYLLPRGCRMPQPLEVWRMALSVERAGWILPRSRLLVEAKNIESGMQHRLSEEVAGVPNEILSAIDLGNDSAMSETAKRVIGLLERQLLNEGLKRIGRYGGKWWQVEYGKAKAAADGSSGTE